MRAVGRGAEAECVKYEEKEGEGKEEQGGEGGSDQFAQPRPRPRPGRVVATIETFHPPSSSVVTLCFCFPPEQRV